MAKFYGIIGYGVTEESETKPGVWINKITERPVAGEIIKNTRKLDSSENLNNNISLSNQISIISDPYAVKNFQNIKYIDWMGTKWKVTTVDVQYPRLVLTLGGVYNGE